MKKKTPIESTSRKHNYYTNGLGYMYVSENAALVYTSICMSFVLFTWENSPNSHRNHKNYARELGHKHVAKTFSILWPELKGRSKHALVMKAKIWQLN